jgi:thiol-disulfide isomerase/thioredoxin
MLSDYYYYLIIFVIILFFVILYFWINQKKNDNNIKNNNQNKIKIYNFNTKWCGWSQKFQPEWDSFMNQLQDDPTLSYIDAYDIKCDDNNNSSMCKKYNVPGFPYVVIDNNGEYLEYDGDRSATHILKYIKEKFSN